MDTLFTQTAEYLKWHESVGRKVFKYENIDSGFSAYGIVVKSKFGNIMYFPFGPQKITQNFLEEVKKIAKKENCFFVRFETDKKSKLFSFQDLATLYFPNIKYFLGDGYLQPRVEWWLDIGKSEVEIYENFSKNHRYSVRKAEKDGVEIEIIEKDFTSSGYEKKFLEIMKETAERDEFLMQDPNYLKAILKSLEEGNFGNNEFVGFLAFSKIENQYNGVVMVLIYRNVANFIYGGSTSFKRESGATVKLQYECIKKAKQMGATKYNFGGIYEENLSKKSLENLSKYKKQYGGYVKYHGVFADLPISKFKYFIYLIYKFFKV